MPGLDGLEVISRLQAEMPDLPVLVLTMHEEDQYVIRAISAGAMGYITKRSAPEQLVKAIRQIREGRRFLSPEAAESLALHVSRGDRAQTPVGKPVKPGTSSIAGIGPGPDQSGNRRNLPHQRKKPWIRTGFDC